LTHSRLDEASLDFVALGFAAFIALVTSAVFGLVPSLQGSRFDLRKSLHESSRGGSGAVRERLRGWLVATEVALALVLLTTTGLMVRSFLARASRATWLSIRFRAGVRSATAVRSLFLRS